MKGKNQRRVGNMPSPQIAEVSPTPGVEGANLAEQKDQALALLRREQAERREICARKINQALADDNCELVAVVNIVGNQIQSRVDIIAR